MHTYHAAQQEKLASFEERNHIVAKDENTPPPSFTSVATAFAGEVAAAASGQAAAGVGDASQIA